MQLLVVYYKPVANTGNLVTIYRKTKQRKYYQGISMNLAGNSCTTSLLA